MRRPKKPVKDEAKPPRKPGSGRKPMVLDAVDGERLRRLIEKHDGVVLAMVDDVGGLRRAGVVSGKPLSRVTLGTRLQRLTVITDDGKTANALEYCSAVRIRSGKPGPHRASTALRSTAELAIERAKVLDALARTKNKDDAALLVGVRTRHTLKKMADAHRITADEVTERKNVIAACAGCRGGKRHSCGMNAAA